MQAMNKTQSDIAGISYVQGLKWERGLQAASAGKRKTGINRHALQPCGRRSGLKPGLGHSMLRASIHFLTLAAGMALFLQFAGAPGVRAAEAAANVAPLPF